jgi:hypothetical protein
MARPLDKALVELANPMQKPPGMTQDQGKTPQDEKYYRCKDSRRYAVDESLRPTGRLQPRHIRSPQIEPPNIHPTLD